MVPRKILIIDDEKVQADALAKNIRAEVAYSTVFTASTEEEIKSTIEDKFYNLAILDIRMDGFSFDGISLAEEIVAINPFTKILFVSKFIPEYYGKITSLMKSGNILGFMDKKVDYTEWKTELKVIIEQYYNDLDENPQQISSALINLYSEVKDEEDTYRKGQRFENFIALLFQNIGFSEILKRVKDKSLNEVDLIVRNDIDDNFLSKFGKYILIECKNKPSEKVDKNDFIVFQNKLTATNGLAELGFIFTTSAFARTAYIEAVRESKGNVKVIFIDNPLIMGLLKSANPRETLKRIIDEQVKDN
ncbi:MAG: response regulator [Barnesiella sp.]|nr:response regulator [Barnesiella sp.]